MMTASSSHSEAAMEVRCLMGDGQQHNQSACPKF